MLRAMVDIFKIFARLAASASLHWRDCVSKTNLGLLRHKLNRSVSQAPIDARTTQRAHNADLRPEFSKQARLSAGRPQVQSLATELSESNGIRDIAQRRQARALNPKPARGKRFPAADGRSLKPMGRAHTPSPGAQVPCTKRL